VRSGAALRTGSGVAVPVKAADPALMAPKARVSELGSIFAIGYRRHLLSQQNSLAGLRDSEAECNS